METFVLNGRCRYGGKRSLPGRPDAAERGGVHRDVQKAGKAYIPMYFYTSMCTDKTFFAHVDAQDDLRRAVRTGGKTKSHCGSAPADFGNALDGGAVRRKDCAPEVWPGWAMTKVYPALAELQRMSRGGRSGRQDARASRA